MSRHQPWEVLSGVGLMLVVGNGFHSVSIALGGCLGLRLGDDLKFLGGIFVGQGDTSVDLDDILVGPGGTLVDLGDILVGVLTKISN